MKIVYIVSEITPDIVMVCQVKGLLLQSPILHADETGIGLNGNNSPFIPSIG